MPTPLHPALNTNAQFDEGDKSFFLKAAAGAVVLLGALYVALSSQTS